MIDLSCYLLEGAGCGPRTLDESVAICRGAVEAGVRTIVATPCWAAGVASPPIPLDECGRQLDSLRRSAGGRVELELGFFLHYSADLPAITDTYGPQVALGRGRHLLISMPATQLPGGVEKTWEELRGRGYSVVLARPECSPALRAQPGRLDEWVRWGAKIQVAAVSVMGGHGRIVKQFAMECFAAYGESVVLASRARSAQSSGFILGQARDVVAKRFGAALASTCVGRTPSDIIGGVEARRDPSERRPSAGQSPSTLGAIRSALSLLKASVQ